MADETSGGTGLQDAFGDVVASPDPTPAVTTVTPAPGPTAEPPEIEMPPEWVGRGSPPRPDHVRNDIDTKQRQASDLRQRAQQLSEQEHRLDADVNVANQLLDARTDASRELDAQVATLGARVAEVEKDVHRHDPDVNLAMDHVNTIKLALGERIPSSDLLTPDGEPATPPPVHVETDPVKIAALRAQLTDAQAQLDRAVAARSGSEAELAKLKEEQAQLAPQVKEAKEALDTQTVRADELKARAQALEKDSVESLDKARGLEAEARNLTDALPDYQQVWDQWAAEHPDQAKVGEGELTLHVPARETAMTYAQGRREEAGRLEQQASDADKAAVDAANGADARTELAQRNDEQATELAHQATLATQRAATLQSEADAGLKRAESLGDESDRLAKQAEELRAAGRTEAADTMKARADAMVKQSIAIQTDADHQRTQATQARESAETSTQRSQQLTADAAKLRTEATSMRETQTTMETEATKLREDAASRDAVAKELEDQLQSGQPFQYQVTDATGNPVDIEVPAGPPPYSPATDPGAAAGDVSTTTDTTTADAPAGPTDSAPTDAADSAPSPSTGDALLGDDITGATPTAEPDAAATDLAGGADGDAAATAPIESPAAAGPDAVDAISGADAVTAPVADPGVDAPPPSDFAEPPVDAATVDPSSGDSLDN